MEELKSFRTLTTKFKKAPEIFCASYSHLSSSDLKDIYSPNEDTFLLIDGLYADLQAIADSNSMMCVEFGPGSGVVTTSLAFLLKKHHFSAFQELRFYTIDVNEKASESTKRTFLENQLPNCKLECITSDFTLNLENLEGKIDILIFNPPYVPCTDEEMQHALKCRDSTAAWAGGYKGREVINRIIPKIRQYLSPTGCFYLLLIEDNGVYRVVSEILDNANDGYEHLPKMKYEVIIKRECLGERQVIIKFYYESLDQTNQ